MLRPFSVDKKKTHPTLSPDSFVTIKLQRLVVKIVPVNKKAQHYKHTAHVQHKGNSQKNGYKSRWWMGAFASYYL